MDVKIRKIIESAISEVAGRSLTLQVITDESVAQAVHDDKNEQSVKHPTADIWQHALNVFGGELLDDERANK